MFVKCDYCGSDINDTDEKCPYCCATNSHYQKVAPTQPKTIEELQLWYQSKNLPPENVTRFFIGKDISEPKAFGIYKDPNTGKFIVYKNKADGSRAIRYEGDDETFAVNEIFQKLRTTITAQKAHNAEMRSASQPDRNTYRRRKRSSALSSVISLIIVIFIILFIYLMPRIFSNFSMGTNNRYYEYDGDYYYNIMGDYYLYDSESGDWDYYGNYAPFYGENYEDYIYDGDLAEDNISDFKDSDSYADWFDNYYDSGNDSGNSWDDDDWDSGWDSNDSWDSDWGGDWDSDW